MKNTDGMIPKMYPSVYVKQIADPPSTNTPLIINVQFKLKKNNIWVQLYNNEAFFRNILNVEIPKIMKINDINAQKIIDIMP